MEDTVSESTPKLLWDDEKGYGFYPAYPPRPVYDEGYFLKYLRYMGTSLGHSLNSFRVELVEKYWKEEVVDVGCAAGHFMVLRGLYRTKGYEVNRASLDWIFQVGAFRDPFYGKPPEAVTFFDSLEHIANPEPLLARVMRYAFVSIPIFRDRAQVLESRHFRPLEHFHYFTSRGLIDWMSGQGFICEESRGDESQLGREDIMTFVFRRV